MLRRLAHAQNDPVADATDWRAQELLLLSQVMRGVGQSLAPAVVLREMLHLMSELLGLNRGRIVLADDGGGPASSTIAHAYGLSAEEAARGRYAAGEGVTGRVLVTGQPAIVTDVDAHPAFLFRAVPRSRLAPESVSFIALPIEVQGRAIGVLACHRMRSRTRPLGEDMAILKILATLAGQLLQLQRLVAATTRGLQQRNEQLSAALQCAQAHRDGEVTAASELPAPPQAPSPALAAASLVREYWPATSHPVEALTAALERHRGNRSRAAQSLGLTPRQFGYRLKKLCPPPP